MFNIQNKDGHSLLCGREDYGRWEQMSVKIEHCYNTNTIFSIVRISNYTKLTSQNCWNTGDRRGQQNGPISEYFIGIVSSQPVDAKSSDI